MGRIIFVFGCEWPTVRCHVASRDCGSLLPQVAGNSSTDRSTAMHSVSYHAATGNRHIWPVMVTPRAPRSWASRALDGKNEFHGSDVRLLLPHELPHVIRLPRVPLLGE
jgi:hypothetical protein